jgi:fructokinase
MIVFTGEALIDFIPVRDAGGKRAYQPAPGGSPYNSSIAAARLDVPARFFGGISHDFFGDTLARNLRSNGVDTELVKRSDNPTTLAFVDKSPNGEARYAFFPNSAADRFILPADLPRLGDDVAALAFGSISLLGEPSGTSIVQMVELSARENGPVISFDPNIRESLIGDEEAYRRRLDRCIAASTIIKVSDEDLMYIIPDASMETAARKLLDRGVALVVVTAGADGSRAFSSAGIAEAGAEKTKVVDTIGAGDSFHAALLAWLFHSSLLSRNSVAKLTVDQLTEMLRFAGAVAAKTCGSAGANPPRLAEVQTRFKFWEK